LEDLSCIERAAKIEIAGMVQSVDTKIDSIQKNVERTETKIINLKQKLTSTERK
jgi:hypothetical protein